LNIEVPLHNGMAKVAGNYAMPGVNDSGAKYLVDIEDPSGGKTGQALPLGASAQLEINDQALAYSFCDIVNPFVYVNATSLSLENTELNEDIMQLSPVMENLEKIRGYIAVKSGLAPSLQAARDVHVAIPKMAMVSEPKDYQTSTGKLIKKEEYDILARMVSVGKMHRTFAVSGLLNLAGACLLNGTVPNKVSRLQALREGQTVRIGHPEGIISIRVQKSMSEEKINYVGLERTARRIMSGNLYIPIH
jgi:2-methylaconitate cis-trans-isomerase PrpF